MNSAILAGTLALASSLIAVPGALASTVTVTGGNTVRVLESGNESNGIRVSYDAVLDLYTVEDTKAALTPSGDCAVVDANTATCLGAGITRIDVDTADRDDTIAVAPSVPSTVTELLDGGPSNDEVRAAAGPGTLEGGSGNDLVVGRGTVRGDSGNDTVVGSGEDDTIRGGSGRDFMDGGNGADDVGGGSGTDALLYGGGRANPVNVTVGSGSNNDGGPEDQSGARRDNVRGDVEAVGGTVADDVIVGDSSSETLIGGPGDDLLVGNRGADQLLGFEGDDLLSGGDGGDTARGSLGNDRLLGGPDGDRLAGGPGDDFLKGKGGSDVMKGKTGIDRIRARDGVRDIKISCGPGPNRLENAKRDRKLDPRAKSC